MSELLDRIDLRFDLVTSKLAAHTITEKGCWEYQGSLTKWGYGRFIIYSRYHRPRKRNYLAHRVSYAYHNNVDPSEMLVCHRCDNPACINPDHLFLGSPKDNIQDMLKKGRGAPQHGTHNPGCKIDEQIVMQIIQRIKDGKNNKEIAKDLSITHSNVSMIRLGKTWRSLTESLGYDPEEYRQFTRSPMRL